MANVETQRERRERRRQEGVCTACGEPVATTEGREGVPSKRRMCLKHLRQLAAQQRRWHAKSEAAA